MRIAYISDAIYPYNKGGKEKRLFEISTRLAKKGHEVHIFGMNWWGGKNKIENKVFLHGISPLYPLYTKQGKRSISQALKFSLNLFKFVFVKKQFDIVDCDHMPHLSIFPIRLATWLRKEKMFITWHEIWGKYWFNYLKIKGLFGYIVELITMNISRNNICVSNKTHAHFNKLSLFGSHKLSNGINNELISKIKPSLRKYDIIFAGRLIKEKNVDLIIDAVGKKYKVGIIGDGPELKRLKKNAPPNVEFLGFLNDIEKVYSLMKSAKVFAFPSLREGFGISVIEANACGCPVVVVSAPNNASQDLIEAGVNGYTSKNDPRDYLNKINKAQKKIKRKECIETAQKYSWGSLIDQIEEVYRK